MSEAPPLVPSQKVYGTVYIVLDDFGKLGRVYRETDETAADAETVIRNLLLGEYPSACPRHRVQHRRRPVYRRLPRVAAVIDIARERHCTIGRATLEFLERYVDPASIPESVRS